jgi:hypothetical protein
MRRCGRALTRSSRPARELTRQSLIALAEAVDTRPPAADGMALPAVVVYNPTSAPQTGLLEVDITLPSEVKDFELVDERGDTLPHEVHGSASHEVFSATLDRESLLSVTGSILYGRIGSYGIRKVLFNRSGDQLDIEAILNDDGEPDPGRVGTGYCRYGETVGRPLFSDVSLTRPHQPKTEGGLRRQRCPWSRPTNILGPIRVW